MKSIIRTILLFRLLVENNRKLSGAVAQWTLPYGLNVLFFPSSRFDLGVVVLGVSPYPTLLVIY